MAPLDWDRDFAQEQSGDDPGLLRELMTLLVDSSRSDFDKMLRGLENQDSAAVADAAHSIKGAAASLGVEGLRKEAYVIELRGRNNELSGLDLAPLQELIDQLPSLLSE